MIYRFNSLLMYNLRELAQSEKYYFRAMAAQDPNTPPDMIPALAADPHPDVRYYITQKKAFLKANPEIIQKFLADTSWVVRYGMVIYSSDLLESSAWEKLAQDEERMVRYALATSKATPANILSILAKDREYDVRLAVTENCNTHAHDLMYLQNDKNRTVKKAAKAKLKEITKDA